MRIMLPPWEIKANFECAYIGIEKKVRTKTHQVRTQHYMSERSGPRTEYRKDFDHRMITYPTSCYYWKRSLSQKLRNVLNVPGAVRDFH